ncbi:hypothetical protein [Mesorhizobium escarrei]|uniref:Uncharacterized protein n=1 Tax=Mesorhizobium escarrei TaxID=666018 RepID=A0ABN8KDT0_9HYPH|nr:hypothetical protein [Mesorhizobium escarrei]CAH2408375.1 hypothetical protein MES5069_680080 [Mesorhizobium escarrei]
MFSARLCLNVWQSSTLTLRRKGSAVLTLILLLSFTPLAFGATNTSTFTEKEIQAYIRNLRISELENRMQFWEEQVFSCKVGNDIFPSKQDDIYDPMMRYNPKVPVEDWMASMFQKRIVIQET